MSRPVYEKTDQTRLAGVERRVTFLERRAQTPEPDEYDSGGGSSPILTYASGSATTTVAAGFGTDLTWTSTHSNGVTIAGDTITIDSDGVYEVSAVGIASVVGPATVAGSGIVDLGVNLVLNLSTVPASGHAMSPVDVPSGKSWMTTLALLAQIDLDGGDELTFNAFNNTSATAGFGPFRVVVIQLA